MTGKEGRGSIPVAFMSKFPKMTSMVIPLYKLTSDLSEVTDSSDSSTSPVPLGPQL